MPYSVKVEDVGLNPIDLPLNKSIDTYSFPLNMYFIIYKTTNVVNGKIYIGAHQTIDKEYIKNWKTGRTVMQHTANV